MTLAKINFIVAKLPGIFIRTGRVLQMGNPVANIVLVIAIVKYFCSTNSSSLVK